MQENDPGTFGDADHQGFAKDYIKEVLASMRDGEAQARRSTGLVLALALLYVIARGDTRSAITVFGLRVEDLSPLLAVIPVITAYQYVTGITLFLELANARDKYHRALAQAYPKLGRAWTTAPEPMNSVLLRASRWTNKNRAIPYVQKPRAYIVLFGPAGLSAVELAYYGARVGWSSVSAVVCALAVTLGVAYGSTILLIDLDNSD